MDTAATIAFLAVLVAVASAWLWAEPLARHWRRARIRRQAFPPAWRRTLRERWPLFQRLPVDLQMRIKKEAQVLLAEVPFIGCAGLRVTDEMRVLVAAQAALLLAGRPGGFRRLTQVLLYPGAFVVQRAVTDGHGITQDARRALAGESWQQGQVILSWQDVLEGAASADDGHNVVIHEFAHQLDTANGPANGAPFLPGPIERRRWQAVMTHEFEALRARVDRGESGLIDPYGASEPAEFFAVVSELFFERPAELAREHPALYREFARCYRIHPLAW
jgi:MtfA peptidase